jgi:hypothetical protein
MPPRLIACSANWMAMFYAVALTSEHCVSVLCVCLGVVCLFPVVPEPHANGTAAAHILAPAQPQAHAWRCCYQYQGHILLLTLPPPPPPPPLLLLLCRSFCKTGAAFLQCLEVSLAVPKALPGSKQLRARFIAFLHRLVESLMATVLPYLPAALEALMAREADVTDMTDVLTLLVQLITRFKEALGKLVEVVLPLAVARVHGLLGECLACPNAACMLCVLSWGWALSWRCNTCCCPHQARHANAARQLQQ